LRVSDPRRAWALCTLALLLPLAGCATILQGSTQTVEVTSDPPGASVLVLPEKTSLVTPGEVDLKRNHVHTLVFELPCHRPAAGYLDRVDSKTVLLNLILGGLIGMAVDFDSGAVFRLTPDPLNVKLERIDPAECRPAPADPGAGAVPEPL
jgi:hypothetical protein